MAEIADSLDSMAMLQTIESEILTKCHESPNGAISMANLLANKQQKVAMPGIYLMAATNLCSQGKVRMEQESQQRPKEPTNLDNLIIALNN